jgi:hypothetical protein
MNLQNLLKRFYGRYLMARARKPIRNTFIPSLVILEHRYAPASVAFAAGSLEITKTQPGAAMTWADPSAVVTNIVPPNDRLEATVSVPFSFDTAE